MILIFCWNPVDTWCHGDTFMKNRFFSQNFQNIDFLTQQIWQIKRVGDRKIIYKKRFEKKFNLFIFKAKFGFGTIFSLWLVFSAYFHKVAKKKFRILRKIEENFVFCKACAKRKLEKLFFSYIVLLISINLRYSHI